MVVESAGDPAALGPEVTREVRAMDKTIALRRMTPLASYVDDAMAQSRFSLLLMAALGGSPWCWPRWGSIGVIAYSVSQRTREFGIRLALGEEPGHTRRNVVFGGMRLVGVSMALGLTAALALARLLRASSIRWLRAIRSPSPGSRRCWRVALLACYLPARRATRVDPALALAANDLLFPLFSFLFFFISSLYFFHIFLLFFSLSLLLHYYFCVHLCGPGAAPP